MIRLMAKRVFPLFLVAALLCGCTVTVSDEESPSSEETAADIGSATTDDLSSGDTVSAEDVGPEIISLEERPSYEEIQQPYVEINGNVPTSFSTSDLTTESFEYYSELDDLGRCGETYACIGRDLMPEEERGSIGQVKPSGWHTYRYDCVDGKYLYNRCHLIGYQLSGENANRQNLITGTRYLNIEGMLPFENLVADYVEDTGNHVMYYVTPVFTGDNLVADGVLMEGMSVEDQGEDIQFCVFCYNNQPGVDIDYATGESCEASDSTCQDRETHHGNSDSAPSASHTGSCRENAQPEPCGTGHQNDDPCNTIKYNGKNCAPQQKQHQGQHHGRHHHGGGSCEQVA